MWMYEKRLEFPLIALVVSGGHTDLVYMKEDYSFERIGSASFFETVSLLFFPFSS